MCGGGGNNSPPPAPTPQSPIPIQARFMNEGDRSGRLLTPRYSGVDASTPSTAITKTDDETGRSLL